jgi:Zinc finger C-x8-C-x5-C-x3-H type (and similar)
MAPTTKKSGDGASKKTENKAKAKIIEDKTFGLKNKNKSNKVGKYIQQVTEQVKSSGNPKTKKEEEARILLKKLKKEEEEAQKAELALLNKPILVPQKVPFGNTSFFIVSNAHVNFMLFLGVDPKSIICQYFKSGLCTKGDKCKFSHDLNIERKSAKIDFYLDARDSSKPLEEEEDASMEYWDQEKLESVVTKKHGPGVKTTTDIVCVPITRNRILTSFMFRCANISWMRLNRENMAGFGSVQMVELPVNTDMRFHLILFLNRERPLLTLLEETKSLSFHLKSSWKQRDINWGII